LEAYVKRRYKVNTRSRASDVGERMDSLQDFVKTQSGRDCLMEFENIMRLLPRVAIIRNLGIMVFLDTPISNITMELTNPKLAGASIYLSTAVYENERTDDQEEIYLNIKTSLATEFSNEDVEFNYAAMFNYGKLTQYGRTHKHPNKYVTSV
jgi:hypothetical protein